MQIPKLDSDDERVKEEILLEQRRSELTKLQSQHIDTNGRALYDTKMRQLDDFKEKLGIVQSATAKLKEGITQTREKISEANETTLSKLRSKFSGKNMQSIVLTNLELFSSVVPTIQVDLRKVSDSLVRNRNKYYLRKKRMMDFNFGLNVVTQNGKEVYPN